MAEKVTSMLLKVDVDLQCPCCYKKIKKILCKFPEIRDQVYDEKQNLVKITVVCCNPHQIRDKLCCKGGKVFISIEIVVPDPKPPKTDPKTDPKPPKTDPKPPKTDPKPPSKPDLIKAEVTVVVKPNDPPKPVPQPPPVGFCCVQCFHGYGGGPCYHGGYGYGRPPCVPPPPPPCVPPCVPPPRPPCVPPPPPPCYENYGYGYSYRKGCDVSRCDYSSEENASACNIM